MSMKSTTGAYLALGDYGVVWSCSKLQKKVADSSTAAETYALHELVKTVIEAHGKLVEMGETVGGDARHAQARQPSSHQDE